MRMKSNLVKMVKAVLALSVGAGAQIAIPNADFESWTTVAGYNPDIPAGWTSSGFFPGIHKEASGHSGSYALKVSIAKYFTGAGSGDIKAGFLLPAITTAPKYFGFWAKVHINGTDHLNVTADLTKAPSNTITTTLPYGMGVLSSADNTSTWTWFAFALETSFPQTTDSASLRFTFSPALDTGSYVIIDDIAFTDTKTAGLKELSGHPILEPASSQVADAFESVVYGLEGRADVSISVYDMRGGKVADVFKGRLEKGKYKTEIDVRKFADGIYHVRLSVGGNSYARKFAVHHT